MLRVWALVLIALGLGGFAGWATLQAQDQAELNALSGYEKALVWIILEDLPAGTTFGEAMESGAIALRGFPKDFLPEDGILSDSYSDRNSITMRELHAGTLLLTGDFQTKTRILPGELIPVDHVAVALEFPASDRGGGLIRAGSRVGVLVQRETADGSGVESEVLFSALSVLAANGEVITRGDLEVGVTPDEDLVILAVPDTGVGKLLRAQESGRLTLVLLGLNSSLPMGQ